MTTSRKAVLALLVVALLVATWLALREAPPTPVHAPRSVASEPTKAAPRQSTIDDDTRAIARARWEDRRAKIRAAHTPRPSTETASPRTSRDCDDSDCSRDAAPNDNDALFTAFVDETTTLTQGCEELLGDKPKSVRIEAHLIGAPDIGTIVESIAVSGTDEPVDALTECLTEGMYTLELGAASTNFERDAVLMLGLLDEVAGEEWLTPEHAREIRQQMIDGGLDPAKDPMVAVSSGP